MVGVSLGVGDKAGVSVASSVPVAVADGTGVSVGSSVSVGVVDGAGVSVGCRVSVIVGVGVGTGKVAVIVAAGVSAVRGTAVGVAVTSASAVNSASGLMLRTRATPRHSRTTRVKPPPTAMPIAYLRRLRLLIVIPLWLL